MFMRPTTLFLLWEMQQERLSSGVKARTAIASTVSGLLPSLSFHLQRTQEGCCTAWVGSSLHCAERIVKGKMWVCRSLLSTPHRQNTQECK